MLFAGICMSVSAQSSFYDDTPSKSQRLRPKYFNLNFSSEKISAGDLFSLKSNIGAAITTGRSYYLHKTPIAGMIRFGIDATWFDLNYTNYKSEEFYPDTEESDNMTMHKAEIAMQVGPSITINPISHLNVHAYFRYAPTFAALYDGAGIGGNYASYFVAGGMVSYGVIGLGVEARWGNCKYKAFGSDGEDLMGGLKLKASGLRAYVSFRF